MAKSSNQKLKLFYIIDMLKLNTDEDHVLSTQEIIQKLADNDIKAERKSIYDDIACLNDYGFDIILKKGKGVSGYYLAQREFELAECKLLVDAVQASRFMTLKKSRELIKKLETMVSKYQAVQLQRQVFVAGRVKTENEKIYYNVDTIYNAIDQNRKISFTYLKWSLSKTLTAKKEGEKYVVSPFALLWADENYYLAAYDSKAQKIKHYRVDKMGDTSISDEVREGKEQFALINPAEYTKQTFGMYGGLQETVVLKMKNDMIGVMIDRFGKDTNIRKFNENEIIVRVNLAISSQFFGWLAGLGETVTIISPKEVAVRYVEWLKNIITHQIEEK